MKQLKMLLDEMHQYVQAFNQNNQILNDNWQDKKGSPDISRGLSI